MSMLGQKELPYLPIVAVSRNDNHGGDMQKRMRLFVNGLIHQCDKHKLACELILVEWNPVAGKPLLHEVLPAPPANSFLTIRYIIVPGEVHAGFAFSDRLPLFQMIGKNAGIRRAKAEYILCTNVDLLFSEQLFERLARRELKPGVFYRANRCDVPNTLDESLSHEKQLEFCSQNIKERLGKSNRYANFASTSGALFRYPVLQPVLQLLSKIKSTYANKPEDKLNELDLNACGDFTLMSKKDWVDIQGYPELEIYSIHIDSMGLLAAAALGKQQVIFNWNECTYHMEHTGGWEFKNPIDKIHFYTNKPMLDWWTVREAGLHLIKTRGTFNLNKPDWGMLGRQLQEIIV